MFDQPNYIFVPTINPMSISVCDQPTIIHDEVKIPPAPKRLPTHCEEEYKSRSTRSRVSSDEKIVASREFHTYLGNIVRGTEEIDDEELMYQLKNGLKLCMTTVTVHLLYLADPKGLNRPDLFELMIPMLIACKPGVTFFMTLIRGLVRIDAWKLISLFIRDDTGSKINIFVFETLAYHIKKRNRRCLRGLPRQGKIANRIRGYLKMRPAKWRHVLAGGSRGSIYSFMSCNDWSKIEYKLLSVQLLVENYKAFMRHDGRRFKAFLELYPDIAAAIKKRRYNNYKYYMQQKEIYDAYVVPMPKETRKHGRD